MKKDTQNIVLVALSIIVVLVVVLGGGYWYMNFSDDLVTYSPPKNSREKVEVNQNSDELKEIALSLDDSDVVKIISTLEDNKSKDLVGSEHMYKTAYARAIVGNSTYEVDIYEYYVYKETIVDSFNNIIGYKYYSNNDKSNLIVESSTDLGDTVFDTYLDNTGIYRYVFNRDSSNEYKFVKTVKVR